MAQLGWIFEKGILGAGTVFTSKVLSATVTEGREKYLDPYSGGRLAITIDNTGNYASNFAFNDEIALYTVYAPNGYVEYWTVQEIDFNDYPGNTGMPTATIMCVDAVGRSGRYQAINKSLTQTDTTTQATQFNSGSGGPLKSDIEVTAISTGNSTASASTYTGTVLNQINLLNATERGFIRNAANIAAGTQRINFYPRKSIGPIATDFSFGRNYGSFVCAYQRFDRIQNGLQFINTVTVSPEAVADQTATNASSVTAYGTTFYSSETVDFSTTQASGNAQWVANTFSDPNSLRFVIEFSDRGQTFNQADFYAQFPTRPVWPLSYRLPGAVSDTTVNVVVEGWTFTITPSQTIFRLNLSPLTYYQFFTLDSTTLGILDTSRLGW
jgi:hypothetical protein